TSTRARPRSTAGRSRSSATSSRTASSRCPRSDDMDLELTDEQTWLSESIDTLLMREWVGPDAAAGATAAERERLWERLVAFGAHLASVPYLGSAAVRFAVEPFAGDLAGGEERIAVALLEPGRGWSVAGARTSLAADAVSGQKVAVEHAESVDRLAVVASAAG